MKTTHDRTGLLPFFLSESQEQVSHFADVSCEERGAIFTRREVVDFILDLVGYTVDRPLHTFRLLEPSFGEGSFLIPAIERLLESYKAHVPDQNDIEGDLIGAIRAVEVHHTSIEIVGSRILEIFRHFGISGRSAHRILDQWIMKEDFLLADLHMSFTHIVGNPPYVRQERIPDMLMAEYRARYTTIYDRADIYIPFIERSLSKLEQGGTIGFICADRWMKNKYGGPLRAMVAAQYHLAAYVDMVDTPAFRSEVAAYPAITIMKREHPGPTRIAHRPRLDHDTLSQLSQALSSNIIPHDSGVSEVLNVAHGNEPWLLTSLDTLAIVRRLEAEFPSIEAAGCRVGIGVATGADAVFIGPLAALDVEPDRKLPLVRTKDIESGTVVWGGAGVINPFTDDGSLVKLSDYPKLEKHFDRHADMIRKRNCAQKNPHAWYRTIDRIYPSLTHQPKLLIPDIKGEAHIVYEEGRFYPHHNLYYIISDAWDLKALQVVLQSGIAKLFVSIYSTHMRGGYLRFQAQYLRRIRLPLWEDVPSDIRAALIEASQLHDVEASKQAIFALYRLTQAEQSALANIMS
ncbi:MAG: Eco57I restriction-modification methylase domain-containing protein [Syntrophaceae bacterium]